MMRTPWAPLCAALGVVLTFACHGDSEKRAQPTPEATAATQPETPPAASPAPSKSTKATSSENHATELEPASKPDKASGHDEPHTHHEHAGHGHGHSTFSPCPIPADQAKVPKHLLDQASREYRAGRFATAFDCASTAADLAPRSIDAHHMRAAAAAGLGRFDIAQVGFALALALDPDDPETLSASADFYINALPRTGRESILVGLEYARRGRAEAVVRRGVSADLRARLALLEAQSLNDLGLAEEALVRTADTLRLAPASREAYHERGVALFNLCRFDSAKDAFIRVLRSAPNDAYAHYHLGLIHERLGRAARSEHHFRKARALSPHEFWEPVPVSAEEFQNEVTEALSELPGELRSMVGQVAIEIVDLPDLDDLTAVDPPFSPTILGLFRGLPLAMDAAQYDREIPDRAIVLYRKNLARAVRSRKELDRQIRQTLLHEIGHLSGLDEDALRRRGLE